MRYYENGVLRSTSSQWAEGAIETFWFYFDYNNAPTTPWAFNFGQQPFINQPAGTVAIQTQNLPAATIVDGREHFQAITGPGTGGFGVYNEGGAVPAAQDAADLTNFVGIASQTATSSSTGASFVFDTLFDVVNTEVTISKPAGGWWANTTVQGWVSPDGAAGNWTK